LQFVAERVRPAGRGALLEALERLKERLAAEGLFATERKRPLPAECRVIGVVTSASGAAFHDICSVAFRRGSARIVLSPALVQGEVAAQSLIAAIDRIERVRELDVLIVGRGGGAFEDLMAFNDEALVRRLSQVRVPVVSAVGHEVDTTLCDWVADVRAATPSEAAELVVPDDAQRLRLLARATAALSRGVGARLLERRSRVERLRAALSDPRFLIADRQQELDELRNRLERSTVRAVQARRNRLESARARLVERHPRLVIQRGRVALGPLSARLGAALELRLEREKGRLSQALAKLDDLSPLAVLGRGYSLVTRRDGTLVRRAGEVQVGERVDVRLSSGRLACSVEGLESDAGLPARAALSSSRNGAEG
jgi:exodeoxyribonuclease VII large subunit